MNVTIIRQMAAALIIAAVALTGCKKDPINISGVSLNNITLTLDISDSETVTPTDAENKAVTWKSDKPDITTVNADGKVTAVKTGTANITVTTTDENKTATCKVTVTEPTGGDNPVTSAKLTMTAPATIATVSSITVSENSDQFFAEIINWRKGNYFANVTGTNFEAGIAYIAIVKLTAAPGYTFSEGDMRNNTFVQGFMPNNATVVFNDFTDGVLTVQVRFPAAAGGDTYTSAHRQ